MALIGISLIVASVVLFCLRPKSWLPSFSLFASLTRRPIDPPAPRPPIEAPKSSEDDSVLSAHALNKSRSVDDSVGSFSQSPPPRTPRQDEKVQVQIEITDTDSFHAEGTSERDQDTDSSHTERSHQVGTLPGAPHIVDGEHEQEHQEGEDEDGEEQEQTTPKASATLRNDPVPSLVLPSIETTNESNHNVATKQPPPPPPPPSFTMTPPPPPPPPALNVEPPAVSAQRMPEHTNVGQLAPRSPPQPKLVAPEQTSSQPPTKPTSIPQLNFEPAAAAPRAFKGPSDLMPPPSLPKPKPKPRSSGLPLPASSSPARRSIPSLNLNGASPSPSPPATRIPTPPTNRIPTLSGRVPSLTHNGPAAAADRGSSPTNSRIPSLGRSSTSPSTSPTTTSRIPSLNSVSSPSPNRAALPVPNRRPPASSGLMPPPTATSSTLNKPSRQVALQPGHSPLDWARLAQQPTSDLRNLPPDTPYLRVTPSMLAQQNGRKGRDAWTAYGGKVYNVTPYVPFHPGGKGELLRGAGKDGTRLFGEVHPWVNYETMLQSCLIGLLVGEEEKGDGMDDMD